MKLVFFGSSQYVIPIIKFLNSAYNLKLVVTTEKLPIDPVVAYCQKNNIPYLSTSSLTQPDVLSQLLEINAPVAILAHFRLIVSPEVIAIFPKGIVNIHPSLLPEYRGTSPGQSAILDGKTKTGVSIMLLDNNVDHGPLVVQEAEDILPTDTSISFYTRAFAHGALLLQRCLDKYIEGEVKPQSQDNSKATFTKKITKQDGYIDADNPPKPEQLDRMIRAYYPWPGVWSKIKMENEKIKIVKFLPEKKIQVEGKKPMSYKDFVNGYPEATQWLERLIPKQIVQTT